MSHLFSPLPIRDVTFRNRIFVSPMCQYSAEDGLPDDWHLVHLGSRAVGGAALVVAEATAVSPEGRISPGDTGLWSARHAEAFAPIADFVRRQGAIPGVQLAHAGRKASTEVPWKIPSGTSGALEGSRAWTTLAPSAVAYGALPAPLALDRAGIARVVDQFAASTRFAVAAGFGLIELHMAHGYLLHEFLSPLSNQRTDDYGGSLENRARLLLEVARAARSEWPKGSPLFARLSCSDWAEGGLPLEEVVQVAGWLQAAGVDLVDCSSGGLVSTQKISLGPGYQVPFARAVRQAGVPSGAVGLITEAAQAEAVLAAGDADAVFLARAMLRDPYWVLNAARELGAEGPWPVQYLRAKA